MPRPSLKKRKDGRYRCKYKDKYFYGETVSEAYAARDAYIKTIGEESEEVSPVTVSEYVPIWIKAHKATVKARTYKDYEHIVSFLTEDFADVPMEEINVTDIKNLYSTRFKGKSDSFITKAKMLYTAIWDTAIEDGIVTHNPCRGKNARPHKGTSGTHRMLTEEEDNLILTVPHRFRLAALVMRYAGLRRGEVLALDIDRDVDFDNHVIHVREAIRYDSNQAIISTTKTESGLRDVPLFSVLEKELKGQHGLVAPSASGKVMSSAAFRTAWRGYKLAIEKYINGDSRRWYGRRRGQNREDMPEWKHFTVRAHDLRHSFCTMLRDSGVDMKLAILWMGHADEKMIIRIYDHITERRISNAIQNVEKTIKGVKTGVNSEENAKNP